MRSSDDDAVASGLERFDQHVFRWERILSGTGPPHIRLWNRFVRRNVRVRFERTFLLAGRLAGRSVADLGAGTGEYCVRAIEHGASTVLAVDSAAGMIRRLSKLRDERQFGGRIYPLLADVNALPIVGGFDLVILNGVFDYTSDPTRVMSEAARICDGIMVASFPRYWAFRAPIRKRYWRRQGLDTFYFTRKRVAEVFGAVDARPLSIDRIGPIFLVVAEFSNSR